MSEVGKAVFLSYASQDAEAAWRICEACRIRFYRCSGRVQDGATPPAFCARVKNLLESEVGARPPPVRQAQGTEAPTAVMENQRPAPHQARAALPGKRRWTPAFVVAVAVGITLTLWGLGLLNPKLKSQNSKPTATSASSATTPPSRETTASDNKSVAILPFENLSDEPGSAYFADGMHEELLMAVSKVSGLKVIGRSSVAPYADVKRRDLAAIARSLRVRSHRGQCAARRQSGPDFSSANR